MYPKLLHDHLGCTYFKIIAWSSGLYIFQNYCMIIWVVLQNYCISIWDTAKLLHEHLACSQNYCMSICEASKIIAWVSEKYPKLLHEHLGWIKNYYMSSRSSFLLVFKKPNHELQRIHETDSRVKHKGGKTAQYILLYIMTYTVKYNMKLYFTSFSVYVHYYTVLYSNIEYTPFQWKGECLPILAVLCIVHIRCKISLSSRQWQNQKTTTTCCLTLYSYLCWLLIRSDSNHPPSTLIRTHIIMGILLK